MKFKVFSLRFQPEKGGFCHDGVEHFLSENELMSVTEHFLEYDGVPWLTLLVRYREKEEYGGRKTFGGVRRIEDRKRKERIDWRATLDPRELECFELLRRWRSDRAHQEKVPPYLILNDQELTEVIKKRVKSLEELRTVKGIGERKSKQWGREILELLERFESGQRAADFNVMALGKGEKIREKEQGAKQQDLGEEGSDQEKKREEGERLEQLALKGESDVS